MIDRSEELGLAARLPIAVGGQLVELRTLNLDESEKWTTKLGASVAGIDIGSSDDPAQVFAALAAQPAKVMLDLVMAYDVDKKLGTLVSVRKRFTQRELYAAVKQMVKAEAPFLEDARSVAEVFGPQLRTMLGVLMETGADRLRRANSTNGLSPNGVSTPTLSVVGSPKNDS